MSASTTALSSVLAGSCFGSALLVSGVFSPAVIVSQLRFSNFHMLEAFLTASAVSAAAVIAADRSGWAPTETRSARIFKLLRFPYSANVVGGLLLGVGMGLTGACPGTVLVQIAAGIPSGLWVALGGLIGGVGFAVARPYVLETQSLQEKGSRGTSSSPAVAAGQSSGKTSSTTVQDKFDMSTDSVLVLYEAMCLAMIVASVQLAPKTTAAYLPPPLGGAFIGLAQAATLLLTRRTVGVSGAYGDIGRWLVDLTAGKSRASLFTPSVLFAGGILAGSSAMASATGILKHGPAVVQSPEPGMAVLGGIVSIVGASLAGGCTSGHGISGMATFSLASFITVAAMFGGGIATAMALA